MTSYLPIIITALLGIIGLIAKTKKDDKPGYLNKLTPFGFVVLALLICASLTTFWTQYNQTLQAKNKAIIDSLNHRHEFLIDSIGHITTISKLELQKQINQKKIQDDSIRFNITLEKFSEQLNIQDQNLHNIQRILLPIKDVFVTFSIEISLDSFPELIAYKERLKTGIEKLLSFYNTENNTDKFIDDTYVSSRNNKNEIEEIEISKKSSLWPNSLTERFAHVVFDQFGDFYFYKTPIETTRFPYLNPIRMTIISDSIYNLIKPINWINPDLKMSFEEDHEKNDQISMHYNVRTNQISLWGFRIKSDPHYWETNGKIISILDLASSQVFIDFGHLKVSFKPEDDNKRVKGKLRYMSLDMTDGINIDITSKDMKFYDNESSRYYVYIFPNDINKLITKRY